MAQVLPSLIFFPPYKTIPLSTQTLPTEKKSGRINFGKDYSMITDENVSRIIFAKITETIGL